MSGDLRQPVEIRLKTSTHAPDRVDMASATNSASFDQRRQTRLAANETSFREVNEAIEAKAAELEGRAPAGPRHLYAFVCECGDPNCADQVRLTLGEYHRARTDETRFVIAADHDIADVERIVQRGARYWLVEKVGEAGRVAERLAA